MRNWFDWTPYIILGVVSVGLVVATLVRYGLVRRRKNVPLQCQLKSQSSVEEGNSFQQQPSLSVHSDLPEDVTGNVKEANSPNSISSSCTLHTTIAGTIDSFSILKHDYLSNV